MAVTCLISELARGKRRRLPAASSHATRKVAANDRLSLIAAAVVAALAVSGMADEPQPVLLETPALRLEIATTPAPFVQRLVHKTSGRAVIAEPAYQGLFSIVLVKEDGGQRTVDSSGAGHSRVRVETTAGERKLKIQYAKFPTLELAVEVTVACREGDPLTYWSLRIDNHAAWPIKAVRFPQLLAVPAIGDGGDDCLVLPALPGTLIENPAENWPNGQSVTLTYPGNLSAQFLAYQDRSAGLYLAGRDTAGYPMSFGVAKQAEGFRCWHEYTPVSDAADAANDASDRGNNWETPYPVAVGVTQGTWCDSADLTTDR